MGSNKGRELKLKANEKIINDFLEHLKLGKPIENKKRKPIGDGTALKYLNIMKIISNQINKPFTDLEEKHIDNFRAWLKKSDEFSTNTKNDIEYKVFGMFLKWIGKPELFNFTKNYGEILEISALSRKEIEKAVHACKLIHQVIWMLLFDGGFRLGEFVNITFKDVNKEDKYYKIRIRVSKTKPRTVSVPLCTAVLDSWLENNPSLVGTNKPLVDLTYSCIHNSIKNQGKKILKKKVYPHLLRHSSATYYCHKLNQYQMCKRYGWSMGSAMPQRYIDREGIDEEIMDKKIVGEENLNYQRQINQLKEEIALLNDSKKESEDKTNNIISFLKSYDSLLFPIIKALPKKEFKNILQSKKFKSEYKKIKEVVL